MPAGHLVQKGRARPEGCVHHTRHQRTKGGLPHAGVSATTSDHPGAATEGVLLLPIGRKLHETGTWLRQSRVGAVWTLRTLWTVPTWLWTLSTWLRTLSTWLRTMWHLLWSECVAMRAMRVMITRRYFSAISCFFLTSINSNFFIRNWIKCAINMKKSYDVLWNDVLVYQFSIDRSLTGKPDTSNEFSIISQSQWTKIAPQQ